SGQSETPSRDNRLASGSRARRSSRLAPIAERGYPAPSGRTPRSALEDLPPPGRRRCRRPNVVHKTRCPSPQGQPGRSRIAEGFFLVHHRVSRTLSKPPPGSLLSFVGTPLELISRISIHTAALAPNVPSRMINTTARGQKDSGGVLIRHRER